MGPLLPLGLWLCLLPPAGATEVTITLAGGPGATALGLGLAPFFAQDPASGPAALAARDVQNVVREDLRFSRHFRLVEQGPPFTGDNLVSILGDWKARGAGWLLTARASLPAAGKAAAELSLMVRLTEVASGEPVFERYYRQQTAHWRSLAHRVADDVVQSLAGRPGIAHTQIAFANSQTGHKEIYIADYDGANVRRLTSDKSIALLPRLSPNRRLVAFTSYRDGNPDLFLLDLETMRPRPFSVEQGLNLAGGFSPDGTLMLLTLSRQKSPNLYQKSLIDGTLTRLTQHFGVDTSPTFSPDAGQVAFVSDRSGNPQVYTLNLTTQRTRRLTQMNWSDSPAWSPTGEWIAFAGRARAKDAIDIFLVDVTGTQVRQLTRGAGSNEDPSWSPDGRFIAFVSNRDGRRPQVYVMDADGSAPHRLLDIPGSSFTPHWSH